MCNKLLLSADWKVRARHLLPKLRNIAALTIKTMVRMKRMPGCVTQGNGNPTRDEGGGLTFSCLSAAPCASSSCCPSSRSLSSVCVWVETPEGSRLPWWTMRRHPTATAGRCCPSWTTPACSRLAITAVFSFYFTLFVNEMVAEQTGLKLLCCYNNILSKLVSLQYTTKQRERLLIFKWTTLTQQTLHCIGNLTFLTLNLKHISLKQPSVS